MLLPEKQIYTIRKVKLYGPNSNTSHYKESIMKIQDLRQLAKRSRRAIVSFENIPGPQYRIYIIRELRMMQRVVKVAGPL